MPSRARRKKSSQQSTAGSSKGSARINVPDPVIRVSKKSRLMMEQAGWSKGDVAIIRASGKHFKCVVVGPSDFPGYVLVKWRGTRHISKAKLDWLERPPK